MEQFSQHTNWTLAEDRKRQKEKKDYHVTE